MKRFPLAPPSLPRRLIRCGCLLLAGGVFFWIRPGLAEPKTFTGRTEVVEVRVPVNVTGKDGEPVRGLNAADFEIYDRGDQRMITGFEVVDLELLKVDSAAGQRRVEQILPSSARRHFLLLFDLSFSSPASVLRARIAARDFLLEALHPTDLAAVAAFTVETGPQLILTFTTDRAQLARAVDAVGSPRQALGLRGAGPGSLDPLRFILNDLALQNESEASQGLGGRGNDLFAESGRIVAKQMDKQEQAFSRGKVSTWASYLQEMARTLDSVKGRKQVIYFSEGFDGRLMLGRQPVGDDEEAIRDQTELTFGNYWMVDVADIYGDTSLQSEVGQMLEAFRRADCVIQSVDISGLRATTEASQRSRRVDQDVLFFLANETGGELFDDTNNLGEQLDRVLARSAVTYVLSFQAHGVEADGSYHPLKVKANLPRGARLAHREGYFAPRSFEELHPLEKNLLASDAIASASPQRDLPIDVLAAPFRAGAEAAYVPVIVEVQGADLLAGQKGDQLAVELYGYATDMRGEMKDFFTQVVSLDLSRRELRGMLAESGLKYYGHLELAPGSYLARVLVRNSATGRTGVLSVPIEVPVYGESDQPVLLPPFFPEQPGRWLMVRERSEESVGARTVIYPFTMEGQPYVPAARPGLQGDAPAQLYLVVYNLGPGEVTLDARVKTANGREIEGGELVLVERTVTGITGLDKLLATFRPVGLEDGDYTLEVQLTDLRRGLQESSSLPFTVLR